MFLDASLSPSRVASGQYSCLAIMGKGYLFLNDAINRNSLGKVDAAVVGAAGGASWENFGIKNGLRELPLEAFRYFALQQLEKLGALDAFTMRSREPAQ